MATGRNRVPKNYRDRIVFALIGKNFTIPENYSLSSAKEDSVEFTMTLKTPSLSTAGKKTQVNTVRKGLLKAFGSSKQSRKKDAPLEPNFTIEDTDHFNVIKINLLFAFKAEYPHVAVSADGKIPVEVEESFIGPKRRYVSKKKKKKELKMLTFSAKELQKPKLVSIQPLTPKMLDKVVGKVTGKTELTLGEFLETKCAVWAKGKKSTLFETTADDALEYLRKVKGNRKLKESHVRKLMRSYIKDGFHDRIMYINELLEIIDGQHGIEAARRLGLRIIFVIAPGWGKKEVTILNVNSESWTQKDFMHMYAEEGNPNYQVFRTFFETHYFDITTCQVMITNKRSGGRAGDAFREGKLIVTDTQLAKAQRLAKEAEAFEDYHPRGCFKRNFVQALQLLHTVKNYKPALLIGKYEKQKDKSFVESKVLSVQEYVDIFVKKYNDRMPLSMRIEKPIYETKAA